MSIYRPTPLIPARSKNPIEGQGDILREAAARRKEALIEAPTGDLCTNNSADARGYFEHAGRQQTVRSTAKCADGVVKRVLFVCTANICRSPMAEAMFNALAEDAELPFRARSAGIAALEGKPIAPNARKVLEESGIRPAEHRARQVSEAMITESGLVLAMGPRHIRELHRRFAELGDEARILPEYLGLADGERGIPDAYGLPISSYRACARQLFGCVEILVQRLQKDSA